MSAKVIDLGAARKRPRAERESLRFRIDADGSLVIRPVREDGIKVPAYVVPDESVDALLRSLAARRAKVVNERIYKAQPHLRPKPEAVARDVCRWGRDGGRKARGGCRRNSGHEGECRDKHGDYTPAICSHIGRPRTHMTNAATNESWLACSHCCARTSPA